ncbi:MAG: gamma-glutamyltransferase family protein [Alphaproteobacteria bacterium]|nr:gamma-glutamyltransferase family protein [Alphaproteobacteria bacterium]
MFELGGNAFDAAVATGFALQVVEPHQNGPAGDMPAILWSARTGRAEVVCGQGVAPEAATLGRFRALGLSLVPGMGLLPAVVPGAFDAWMLILRNHGTLRLRDVLAPAIAYARDGFTAVPALARAVAGSAELFRAHWPTSAATYLPDGQPPADGDLMRLPALAATYTRVLSESEAAGGDRDAQIEAARRCFYRGFIAEAIDAFCRTTAWADGGGERHGGLLTGDDLARWETSVEPPASLDYGGYTVLKCPAWSQGPVFLQQLSLLSGFDLGALDPYGPDFVHLEVEAAKLALADREAWYGDSIPPPLTGLLDPRYAAQRRKLIGEQASLALRPGSPAGKPPRLPELVMPADAAGTWTGDPGQAMRVAHEGDTVHLDAADRHGNMISAMPSGGWLQSSPVIPALGFPLGTRGQMFWLEEGLPASLQPGRRPRTTLSPGMALRDGKPALAFGSPGGDQQDQWALTFFLRHLHGGMDMARAIEAPAFHSEHAPASFFPRQARPGVLVAEDRFSPATLAELARRGHRIEAAGPWALGRLVAVGCETRSGACVLKAAATPRWQQALALAR